jgi:hypothetical protein
MSRDNLFIYLSVILLRLRVHSSSSLGLEQRFQRMAADSRPTTKSSLPGLATQWTFELKFRSYALQPLSLSLPFASLSIRNIVPETSPLLIARKEGYVAILHPYLTDVKEAPMIQHQATRALHKYIFQLQLLTARNKLTR